MLPLSDLNRKLFLLLIAVLGIKASILAVDHQPALMFGDSASYLTTALIKWIPPDRSFAYGFLLRRFVVRPHSLEPIVVLQVFISAIASWLVGVCLVRFFQARFRVAAVLSVACAFEPLHLMFERFVLSDVVASFGFALVMFTAFSYLRRPSFITLALIQILSVLTVSIRLAYLPVALLASVFPPLLSAPARHGFLSVLADWRSRSKNLSFAPLRPIAVALVFSLALSQYLLYRYRHLYGELIHKPPAYLYADGCFSLGVVVTLVEPADFPDPSRRAEVFRRTTLPRKTVADRPPQHWMKGGMCDAILSVARNEDEANELAKETAMNAARRNPLGVLRVSAKTYFDFFDYPLLAYALRVEQGRDFAPSPEQVQSLKKEFGIDALHRSFDSVTMRWQQLAFPWYWFLLTFPFFYFIYLCARWRRATVEEWICGLLALLLVFDGVVPAERNVTRYLLGEAWLSFLMIGSLFSSAPAPETEEPIVKRELVRPGQVS